MTKPMTIIQWGHDALAADLARKLRMDGKAWTWLNATIGAWSGPRPDIMAFPRYRYDVPQIHAYEIKVSRADMLSDLNSGKWRKYLEHCQSVTFALPHGIASKDDIPIECGVMFRTGRGWRTERRATNVGSACSTQAMAKLLTVHPVVIRETEVPAWQRDSTRSYARGQFLHDHGKQISRAVASLAADIADGRDPSALARDKADKIISDAKVEAIDLQKAFAPLLEMLGLDPNAGPWAVKHQIAKLMQDMQANTRVKRVEDALQRAREALDAVVPVGVL